MNPFFRSPWRHGGLVNAAEPVFAKETPRETGSVRGSGWAVLVVFGGPLTEDLRHRLSYESRRDRAGSRRAGLRTSPDGRCVRVVASSRQARPGPREGSFFNSAARTRGPGAGAQVLSTKLDRPGYTYHSPLFAARPAMICQMMSRIPRPQVTMVTTIRMMLQISDCFA